MFSAEWCLVSELELLRCVRTSILRLGIHTEGHPLCLQWNAQNIHTVSKGHPGSAVEILAAEFVLRMR